MTDTPPTRIVGLKYDEESSHFMSVCGCGASFSGTGRKAIAAAEEAQRAHVCPPPTTRTLWLSFCDGAKPAGQQFLGVCVVDVTPEEADEALIDVLFRFPLAEPGAQWIAAAVKKAHRAGCNPGGEVATADITDATPPAPLPKNRLLSFKELEDLGLRPRRSDA